VYEEQRSRGAEEQRSNSVYEETKMAKGKIKQQHKHGHRLAEAWAGGEAPLAVGAVLSKRFAPRLTLPLPAAPPHTPRLSRRRRSWRRVQR
jgi:hypothetical protein